MPTAPSDLRIAGLLQSPRSRHGQTGHERPLVLCGMTERKVPPSCARAVGGPLRGPADQAVVGPPASAVPMVVQVSAHVGRRRLAPPTTGRQTMPLSPRQVCAARAVWPGAQAPTEGESAQSRGATLLQQHTRPPRCATSPPRDHGVVESRG